MEEEDLPHNNTHLLTVDLKDRHLCDMVNRNEVFEEHAIDIGVANLRAVSVRCCDSAFLVFVCLKRRYSLVLRRIRIPHEWGDGWVSFDKEHFAHIRCY